MQEQQETLDSRVAIARDVLKQLDEKRLIAHRGVYLRVPEFKVINSSEWGYDSLSEGMVRFPAQFRESSVKQALAGKKCEVCALGALFAADVDRANGIKVNDLPGYDTNDPVVMRRYLTEKSTFSDDQLRLIELAFEGRSFIEQYEDSLHEEGDLHWDPYEGKVVWDEYANRTTAEPAAYLTAAITFTQGTYDAEERMRMIMLNIISHGGEFRP